MGINPTVAANSTVPIPSGSGEITRDLLEMLVCPRDKAELRLQGGRLHCTHGHPYTVIEGVPILLVSEAGQTHVEGSRALQVAESGDASQLPRFNVGPGEIDPFVQNSIGATNGSLYADLIGKLTEYPIPRLRLPAGNGGLFLEIGCNWGRWCVAAARAGYRPVGIDPSLKAVRAAQRVSRQLGISALYAVADGRYLPFRAESFNQVFSYSVLQHLSPENVRATLHEIRRVLQVGGASLVQMPNAFGVRCLYHQARRRFREARDFEVRYGTPSGLRKTFQNAIGPSRLSVDGFFSLNAQISDARLLPLRHRLVVYASETLRLLSTTMPPMTFLADSLYVPSQRKG
jgi:SAM-dependent methyltransferase/uncharacterized protein YbaR (Trm112 family)